eukprot:jgi/Chlat1/2141/Chrsp17S08743
MQATMLTHQVHPVPTQALHSQVSQHHTCHTQAAHRRTPCPLRSRRASIPTRQHHSAARRTMLVTTGYLSLKTGEEVGVAAKELTVGDVVRDGTGPPRFFCPLVDANTRPPLNAPLLLYLPGIDGTGFSAWFQFKPLMRLFEVQCLHVPRDDRTHFRGLLDVVLTHVRAARAASPDQPIYLLGESFGGMMALAVDIALSAEAKSAPAANSKSATSLTALVLANPATCYDKANLAPLFPLLPGLPSEAIKMAQLFVKDGLPPQEYAAELSQTLLKMLPGLQTLTDLFPRDTLQWKLGLLKEGAVFVNGRLSESTTPTLVLAAGRDNLVPSAKEGRRLRDTLPQCTLREFPESGHALLLEADVDVASEILAAGLYTRKLQARQKEPTSFVSDFVPPSKERMAALDKGFIGIQHRLVSPIFLSTDNKNQVSLGLTHMPTPQSFGNRPVLFVGNHQLNAPDLGPLIKGVYEQTGVMLRGLAHPIIFGGTGNGNNGGAGGLSRLFQEFGAVSGKNAYKLLSEKQAVLLYPGGVREAFKRRGESYRLFWPDTPEFVRLAARLDAVIVPIASVGGEDGFRILLDSNELLQAPFIGDWLKAQIRNFPAARQLNPAAVDETFVQPLGYPTLPSRYYFLFGKAFDTRDWKQAVKDRAVAAELYGQVKSQLESDIEYLLRKREEDPYLDTPRRLLYEATWGGKRQAPTFQP